MFTVPSIGIALPLGVEGVGGIEGAGAKHNNQELYFF